MKTLNSYHIKFRFSLFCFFLQALTKNKVVCLATTVIY